MTLVARLFLLVIIAVLPAIGIQVHNVVQLHGERMSGANDQARSLLHLVEREQARLVAGVRQVAVTVSEGSFLRTGENARCQAYLDRLARRSPDHQYITATDRAGMVLCSGTAAAVGRSIADRPFFHRALESGGFTVGEWMRWPPEGAGGGEGDPMLPFAVPWMDAEGNPGGVVVTMLSLPWFAANLAASPLPENASLTIADRDGIILANLANTAGGGSAQGERLPPHLFDLLNRTEGGLTEVTGLDGVDRVLAYSPVGDGVHDLFIAVGIDREAATRHLAGAIRQGTVMTLLGLLLAGLAAWLGGTLFIRQPVAALMAAADRWRAGDWGVRADLGDGRSEIGQLGQAFDGMAEALEERERALSANERHLRTVLDSLPVAVAVLSPDGTLLQANHAALAGAGLKAGDVVGRPFEDTGWWSYDPAVRARLRTAIERAAGGVASRVDMMARVAEGRLAVVDFTLAPMHGADGRVTHLLAAGIDVTERRRTEEALRVAEERFRTALKNSGVVVFNQDRDLRFTWINNSPLFPRAEDVLGRTDLEVFERPRDAQALVALKRRVLDSGEGARDEIRLRVHGRDRFFDLTVEPLRDAAGAVVGITCAAVDVTERRRGEDAVRRASEEAERANAAKSKFLAVASHDLRQPVQSLFLFTAALADRLDGHPATPLLDNLRQSLDALKDLLDGLLDMSRLESGKIVAKPMRLKLDDLLGRLAAEYGPRARQKGLELTAVRTGAWVESDPALLERILRNLLENALRYTRRGRILLGARRTEGRLRVEVWDTGVGIPADQLDVIFEEFTQLDDSHGSRGLGLGLAIVKRLARLLGHPVSVRSAPGRGSAFALEVPRVAAPELPIQVRHVANDSGSKGLVMVIDDEAIILLGLKAMLEGWGYEVLAARSGDQALSLLEKDGRRPRLVLADYQLQNGKTGPEAIVAIQGRLGEGLPGIILTGDTTPERLAEAERNGFRVLHKPVFPNELRQAMAAAGG
ncbi:MAG TPA: PAS domain-containing protein [Azospirillum sp.]|nr:PAS domain-containing protein [Azospirillum sp.]